MKKEKDLLSRGVVEDFQQVYEDGHFPVEITFEEFLETHVYCRLNASILCTDTVISDDQLGAGSIQRDALAFSIIA